MYNDVKLEKGLYNLSGKILFRLLRLLTRLPLMRVLPLQSWTLMKDSSSVLTLRFQVIAVTLLKSFLPQRKVPYFSLNF